MKHLDCKKSKLGQNEKKVIKDFSKWSQKCVYPDSDSLVQEKRNRLYRNSLINLLDLKYGDKILDIGCGTGDFLIELDNKYKGKLRLTGIDVTPHFIEIAKGRTKQRRNIKVLNMSLNQLKFKNNTFHYIFAMRVLHHIKKPVKIINRIRKVLKKGGIFVVFDWCRDYDVVKAWDVRCKKKEASHQKFYTSHEAKELLENSGLSVTAVIKKNYYMILLCKK